MTQLTGVHENDWNAYNKHGSHVTEQWDTEISCRLLDCYI